MTNSPRIAALSAIAAFATFSAAPANASDLGAIQISSAECVAVDYAVQSGPLIADIVSECVQKGGDVEVSWDGHTGDKSYKVIGLALQATGDWAVDNEFVTSETGFVTTPPSGIYGIFVVGLNTHATVTGGTVLYYEADDSSAEEPPADDGSAEEPPADDDQGDDQGDHHGDDQGDDQGDDDGDDDGSAKTPSAEDIIDELMAIIADLEDKIEALELDLEDAEKQMKDMEDIIADLLKQLFTK